jgi:zeta-carotene desaturase
VLVLEARPSPGGRASTFTDPATGERVDNGQHVLTGGYRETFRFLRRLGTEHLVHVQPGLEVDIVDRQGRASRLACPAIPAPLHLLAGAMRWPAIDWHDRLALLRLRPGTRRGERPHATVREWLDLHGQTPRLVELLWEPLAVAALNQSIDEASGDVFSVVLRRMFTTRRLDSSLGLPLAALDELYVQPACEYVRRRGGEVRTGAPARVSIATPPAAVRVRDGEWRPRATICATAWYALPAVFEDRPQAMAPVIEAAGSTAASPRRQARVIVPLRSRPERAASPRRAPSARRARCRTRVPRRSRRARASSPRS